MVSALLDDNEDALRQRGPQPADDELSIHTVIDSGEVHTLFQPVIHLATGGIAGFEALSRGPVGSPLESPDALLSAAAAVGRLGELDWLCRVRAMQTAAAADLHPSLSWLINVEPAGLEIPCPDHLLGALTRARSELRVVLEVVERNVEGRVTDLLRATDQARRDSWGVALDNVGAEEASLSLLPFLRPDVVKLDMRLVRQLPQSTAAAITGSVQAYAEQTQAVIVAEGIETDDDVELARVFGATYGQGYRYQRPGPLPASVVPPRDVIPLRQRLSPLDGGTPFEVLSAMKEIRRAPKAHLMHMTRNLEDRCELDSDAAVLLACFQNNRYFSTGRQERYAELARANALTVVLGENMPVHAEPRYQVVSLHPGSRLGREWVVIVLSPHYAGAFVARDCGDTGPDHERRFDYVYTHDRDTVVMAARSTLQELKPLDDSAVAGMSGMPEPEPEPDDAPEPAADPNRRKGRMTWGRPRT